MHKINRKNEIYQFLRNTIQATAKQIHEHVSLLKTITYIQSVQTI